MSNFQSSRQSTGRYGANKRDYHGNESLGFRPTRRTIQVIIVVLLLFLIFTFIRNRPETEVVSSKEKALHSASVSSTSSKFAIVTFETRDVTYWKESLGNKITYTRRHGYELFPTFQNSPLWDKAGVWAKIPLVIQTFDMGDFEWVMWMDFDTLFMNMSRRMEDFVDDVRSNHLDAFNTGQKWEDVGLIATPDCLKFNAGIMLFRNTDWTRSFLDTVWARRHTPSQSEQDIMRVLLEENDEFGEGNKHLLRVPQYKLNSYPDEIKCIENEKGPWRKGKWEPGDWIIHFPGAWAVLQDSEDPFGTLLRRYYPRIVG